MIGDIDNTNMFENYSKQWIKWNLRRTFSPISVAILDQSSMLMLDESKSGSYLRQKSHKAQIDSGFCSMHTWEKYSDLQNETQSPSLYSFVTFHANDLMFKIWILMDCVGDPLLSRDVGKNQDILVFQGLCGETGIMQRRLDRSYSWHVIVVLFSWCHHCLIQRRLIQLTNLYGL